MPIIDVKINTPIKSVSELITYSERKVSLRTKLYSDVVSKKLLKIIMIGIATINDIKNELKYQIFILAIIIYFQPDCNIILNASG